MNKQFILIENPQQLEVFFKQDYSSYIPVVYDVYCQAVLENKNQEFVTINHCMSYSEIVEVYRRAREISEIVVSELDKLNSDYFNEIFGCRGIELFRVTSKYLLNCAFFPNVFHCMIGLLKILEENRPCSLSYFTFNLEEELRLAKNSSDYYCPKRIIPHFLRVFDNISQNRCIELNDHVSSSVSENLRVSVPVALKDLLKRISSYALAKKFRLRESRKTGKSFLVISPNSHMVPVIQGILPNEVKWLNRVLIQSPLVIQGDGLGMKSWFEGLVSLNGKRLNKTFSCDIVKFDILYLSLTSSESEGSLFEKKIVELALRIVKAFFNNTFHGMINVWEEISRLDARYHFDGLLWGYSPTINIENGLISEYFRLKRKPRIGVQHGGAFACKDYGYSHFVSDYDTCEYFVGYGYSNRDLEASFPAKKSRAKILCCNAADNGKVQLVRPYKRQLKVMYVLPDNGEVPFLQLARPNRIDEFLYNFQKSIVDKLSQYNRNEIMIKFAPNNYDNHPLSVYMNKLKHSFVIETMPFSAVLKKYFAEFILIDIISTPLEQSLHYESQILAYNHTCAPLTYDAQKLLSKRAVITSDETEFLTYIDKIFDNTFPTRDIQEREYMNKYGTFPFSGGLDDLDKLFSFI